MFFEVKQFVCSADGKSMTSCADKIAVNEDAKRFAVTDGVSASYMPEIWAEILATSFVSCSVQADKFLSELDDDLLSVMSNKWQTSVHDIEQQAEGIIAKRYERNRRLFGQAASTLAGISVYNDILHYYVIGDSCIFLVNEDGFSVYSDVKDEDSFSNTPNYISSSKFVKGEAIVGQAELSQGWLLLMTDALSEWFWHQQKKDSSTVKRLWNIKDQNEFKDFVNTERDRREMNNDDVALLMIKIVEDGCVTIDAEKNPIEVKCTNAREIDSECLSNDQESISQENDSCKNVVEYSDNDEKTNSNSKFVGESSNVKNNCHSEEADTRCCSKFYSLRNFYRTHPIFFRLILLIHRYQKPVKN